MEKVSKKICLLFFLHTTFVFLFLLPIKGRAQVYRPVDAVSSVKITIKNFGMAIDGILSGLDGDIIFNTADLKNSHFAVTLDVRTINTDIAVRDSTLQTAEYLDTKRFPRISFVSKQIIPAGKPDAYLVKGMLTIKGISKETSFPVTVLPKDGGLLFTGEMKINRLDFKIAVGSTVLSDNLTVSMKVFAKNGNLP